MFGEGNVLDFRYGIDMPTFIVMYLDNRRCFVLSFLASLLRCASSSLGVNGH